MKKILLVHLAANGDCLMATTIARQIKHDYPGSHLTWAISYKHKHILDNNPHVDSVWEIRHDTNASPFSKIWYEVRNIADERKARGEYDLIFYSQIYPEHAEYYDGTTRSSTFNGYPNKITVPVEPVINLSDSETNNVRRFVNENNLSSFKKIVLFECSPGSGQSFMNSHLAIELSDALLKESEDLLIIISSHLKIDIAHKRMIDGSILTFRENAELSNYCTHFIGCSSGLSWLLTSSWAKQLPMLQILNKNKLGFGFASVKYDYKYWNLPTNHIIETTETDKKKLIKIISGFLSDFSTTKTVFDEELRPSVHSFKHTITLKDIKGNIITWIKIIKQYSTRNELSFINIISVLYYSIIQILLYYFNVIFVSGKKSFKNILLKSPYTSNILKAIKWRVDYYRKKLLKLFWLFKRLFDFSQKEKTNGISVVVVGRNDNYGGDFSKRLQTTLDWNLSHLPNPELIYVEWNQIKERPSDCEWIVARYPNAKCYIVSNEIHKKINDSSRIPMMEYFAKNIGIRRATNEWILMINADVFIGTDVIKNIRTLNDNTVYGTHYISIKWDKKPINSSHQKNKKIIVSEFPASNDLSSVVGNFILTHKKNWFNATGYDESLNNVRAGVDTNGLRQLLYLGLKQMVLGQHFHLDHPESIIHGKNDTHGSHSFRNIPYKNSEDWGMAKHPLKQISERIWEL